MKPWMWCVLGTILCWGAYVPTIHAGQSAIGTKNKALWAFLFVGAAYCLVAVLMPVGLMVARQELAPGPTRAGAWISLLAGALGALGALCIVLASLFGGKPIFVAPLVFAGAPIVATLVSMMIHRPSSMPSPWFFAGILLAAAGAGLVLRFKPAG